MVILGYDPGGAGAGGVAVVDFQSSPPIVQTSTCDSVDEAVEWFQAHDGPPPTAIGVDSLLSWSTLAIDGPSPSSDLPGGPEQRTVQQLGLRCDGRPRNGVGYQGPRTLAGNTVE